jgi:hypothetical protein
MASLYDPSRVTFSAAKNFVAENVTALTNFAEYLAPGELKSVDELKPGKGAIIREGLRKIAAYRDEQGQLHRVVSRVHPCRLSPPLEFLRTVLGLPLPRIAFFG